MRRLMGIRYFASWYFVPASKVAGAPLKGADFDFAEFGFERHSRFSVISQKGLHYAYQQ